MIKIEKVDIWGWEHAIRGMRNPLNSWDRSDSNFDDLTVDLGKNDHDLMLRLCKAGSPHRKYLRQIMVSLDITAPLYWWKEFDTYKVGTTADSCSTMHKIQDHEFTLDDFSHDHMNDKSIYMLNETIRYLNGVREAFIESKSKDYWWQMIQILPSSFNQKRTVTLNYEVLLNMLEYRQHHKLDEWNIFCEWIQTLPYADILKAGCRNEQG